MANLPRAARALCCLTLLGLFGSVAEAQTPPDPAEAPAAEARAEIGAEAGAVSGTIYAGDTETPLPGAGVEVRALPDSTLAGEAVTGEGGRFLVRDLSPGRYVVRVEHLGYGSPDDLRVTVSAGRISALGTLALPVVALDVDGVVVAATQPAVTFDVDRTTYHVGGMPDVAGGAVSDILESIPELEVDIDGRITLRGSTPAIYIDGRPAPLRGEALVVFLEQFSADHVDRVEVIDNPSARYRAEGSGGILNIELKEGVELGVSGSVYANAGTRGRAGAGARGTLQRGDWTINAGLTGGLRDRESSSYDLRQNLVTDPTTFLLRESDSDRDGTNGRLDLDVEYRPDERIRVWTEARLDGNEGGSERVSATTHMDEHRDPTLRYDRIADGDSRSFSGRAAAGFDYVWERRVHELEIEVRLDRDRDRDFSLEEYLEEAERDAGLLPAEWTEEWEREAERELSLGVDYERPLGEDTRVEVGYEAVEERDDQSRRLVEATSPDGASPEERTDGFGHARTFHSAYADVRRSFGDLGAQIGVRAEHEDGTLRLPTGETFEDDALRLFPSASLSYRIDRGRQLRLSYSQRIRRPSGNALDPTDRSTDPLERRVGNPDLEPEFTHSVSMESRWSGDFGYLRLAPYFRTTVNERSRITTVDEDGIATRTWANVASTDSWGASLSFGMPRSWPVGGRLSLSGRRETRDAANLSDRYSGSSFRWSSRLNLRGEVTDALSATSRFRYSSGTRGLQGRTSGRLTGDVGFRYRFMDDRASIRVSLRDPFGLQRSTGRASDATYVQLERSVESTRSARINISYSFGGEGRRSGGR